ncbi:LacI family DNA-binding transcriptional regulator [Bacillus sp. N1-1]|uniref:LacI family DNA-binding transcriptional regulator n=1 Tax=Bacillus sp. N1-1 TaxID=2682541 RepID=UPI00131825B5|nr:LacI family DNA-binding transcriptional regulator [Bacillus sp. N1-1]QHA94136.1 LacI family DNA-binding transcriptional regulator [Bacillus sp. N1-1]
MKRVKLDDVAKAAGVTRTTVSRVINNRGYISERTRKKVKEAMEELHYYPNDLARSLYKKKTRFIGLIVPTISNPFFGELTFHVENILADLGYKVILCNSLNNPEKEESYSEMLIRHQVDGIIVCSHNRGVSTYQRQNIPVVAIDRYLSPTVPVISSDNYKGGKMAVEHLIDKGCKNIVHINGPSQLETPTQLRRKAYEDIITNPITYEIQDVFDGQQAIELIRKIFSEVPQVDGIFASDDMIGVSCLNVAREKGIKVPEELKVVGYDGTKTLMNIQPNLTTIRQPIESLAQSTVSTLLKLVDDPEANVELETILPVKLLENRTT